MTAVSDMWVTRIGPDGARSLRRRLHSSRIGGLLGLGTVAASSISILAGSPDGASVSILGGVAAMVTFFALASHHLICAQKQAVVYLGLPSAQRKYLPIREIARFDQWIAGHDRPLWPFTGAAITRSGARQRR